MKEIINPAYRNPKEVGILPIYDKNCEILILGSITSLDGINKGFNYASSKNQLWQLLDLCLNTNCFCNLKNQLKLNYENFKNNTINEKDFLKTRKIIQESFKNELLNRNLAVCDIFSECYFNNNSSMDIDIILNNDKYPYKTNKDILQYIIDNTNIKTIIVTSKFVENQLKRFNLNGNFNVEYVISPSPRRGGINKKIEIWKQVFDNV